jgi:hypothetical protein
VVGARRAVDEISDRDWVESRSKDPPNFFPAWIGPQGHPAPLGPFLFARIGSPRSGALESFSLAPTITGMETEGSKGSKEGNI